MSSCNLFGFVEDGGRVTIADRCTVPTVLRIVQYRGPGSVRASYAPAREEL